MKQKYKIMYGLAAILAIISWVIAIYNWDKLPDVIPVHFGIDGQADGFADKSLFSVFFIPGLQTLMLGLFIFLYYKPQYSNIPTTMWLMALDDKQRNHAFGLIRLMHAGVAIWVGVLLTYITYGSIVSALNNNLGLSTGVMLAVIGLMIVWLIYWTVKIYRATKQAVMSVKSKK
jgi:uncharacterized membrane protein